jgi:hypothetical protein
MLARQKDTTENVEFNKIIQYKTSLQGAKFEFKINIFKRHIKKLCISAL